MNIPDKVKIGGFTYTIKDNEERLENGVNYTGEIDYRNLEIRLKAGLPEERKKQTLLHEIMHGIYDVMGIFDHDEVEIDRLAHQLHQVIVDNPEMFKA